MSSPSVGSPSPESHDEQIQRHILAAIHGRKSRPVRNVNEIVDEQLTFGQRTADSLARNMGSWTFIVVQGILLSIWIVINSFAWLNDWDPYPFILLNLVLSFQAAFAAPIIMMSQNRQAERDRIHAEQDYEIDRQAEREVIAIQARLDDLVGRQWDALVALQNEQIELLRRIEMLTNDVRRATTST